MFLLNWAPVTGWKEADYKGDFKEFRGTLLEPNNDFGVYSEHGVSDGCTTWMWGSWKCRCQQKMPVSE